MCSQASGQTADRLFFDIAGSTGAFAVSNSGQWFIKNGSVWASMGNLFQASGVEPDGRVVCAIATYSAWGLFALCQDGSFFYKNDSPTLDAAAKDHIWSYAGNVFEAIGRHPPDGIEISSFVTYGYAGCDLVLSNGDWYEKTESVNHFDWRLVGNIYEMAGVVHAGRQTLGSMKRAFH